MGEENLKNDTALNSSLFGVEETCDPYVSLSLPNVPVAYADSMVRKHICE